MSNGRVSRATQIRHTGTGRPVGDAGKLAVQDKPTELLRKSEPGFPPETQLAGAVEGSDGEHPGHEKVTTGRLFRKQAHEGVKPTPWTIFEQSEFLSQMGHCLELLLLGKQAM